MFEFRALKSDEIEVRIGQINNNGLTLLLYKNARVDIAILNETVGLLGWKREHKNDNKNCIVSLWDSEKSQWVSREDVGSESSFEKEKGLASDSFKRSCVNFGIGIELYTAPFMWVNSSDCKIIEKNRKLVCYDKFDISHISCDGNKVIDELNIKNASTGKEVFTFKKSNKTMPKEFIDKPNSKEIFDKPKQTEDRINSKQFNDLQGELLRTGVPEENILNLFKVKKFSEFTQKQYDLCMNKFKKTPDKPKPLSEDYDFKIPETDDEELPFE